MKYAALLLATILSLSPEVAAARSEEGEPSKIVSRTYMLHNLGAREARMLLEEKLDPPAGSELRIETEHVADAQGPAGARWAVRVVADPEIQDRVRAVLRTYDVPARTRAFQVLLLEASRQASPAPDLPAGALRALEDLRQLFPYKGYKLLQSALVRLSEEGSVDVGGGYRLDLRIRGQREADAPIIVERFQLLRSVVHADGKPGIEPWIQTSFSMRPAETVVVGTSKLDGGDAALVVLVTALD